LLLFPKNDRSSGHIIDKDQITDLGPRTQKPLRHNAVAWANVTDEGTNRMQIKITSVYGGRPGQGPALLHGRIGLRQEDRRWRQRIRWLTVVSPEEPDGTELQLALNEDPAAKTFQQALFQQSKPPAMFYVDDVQREYERMQGLGAQFTMPPTKVTGSTIAMLNDTCGNVIQLTKLDW
jgi:hypothetical protein